MTLTHEFKTAMVEHYRLQSRYGQKHLAVVITLMAALELSPVSIRALMHCKAIELGLVPRPDGYLEDGTACYLLRTVAAVTGNALPESLAPYADTMFTARGAGGLDTAPTDPALVYRNH
jgi:hypothetical protein